MNRKVRKTLITVAKLAVAAALLWWAFRKAEWPKFRQALVDADPWLMAAAAACFAMPMLVLSVRWWYLLRILEIRIPLGRAVRLTFLGTFFNYVIPGTVSGDLVKAYYLARHCDRKAAVLVSVFTDRVVGLLEFALFPAVVMVMLLLSGMADWNRLWWPAIIVPTVLLGVLVSLTLMLSPGLRRRLGVRWLTRRLPMQGHLAIAAQAAGLYRSRLRALAAALLATFAGQLCFVVAHMLAGMSIGLPIPWHEYLLYVPLIYIIAAVPISPGGLGIAENLYVLFLGGSGDVRTQLLVLALVARAIPMFWSLPGLLVAVRGPSLPDAQTMQAEMAGAADGPQAT